MDKVKELHKVYLVEKATEKIVHEGIYTSVIDRNTMSGGDMTAIRLAALMKASVKPDDIDLYAFGFDSIASWKE